MGADAVPVVNQPKNVPEVLDLIAREGSNWSDAVQRAAKFLEANSGTVASSSADAIAEAAGVDGAMLTVLARNLGFVGFSELRRVFRRDTEPTASATWYELGAPAPDDRTGLAFHDMFAADIDNLEATIEKNSSAAVEKALVAIEQARKVLFMGRRSMFSAAHLFNYIYHFFRDNGLLVSDQVGGVSDDFRWLQADDTLIAISIWPYSTEIIQAAEYAQRRGARLVAITDDAKSPLVEIAEQTGGASLFFASDTPSFFHSNAAAISLAHTLVTMLFFRGGDRAMEQWAASGQHAASFASYTSHASPLQRDDEDNATH